MKMKNVLLSVLAVSLITVGCGKEEAEFPAPSPSAPPVSANPVATTAGTSSGATTTQATEAFDPSKLGPPPPPTVDFTASANGARPVGNLGQDLNDLELLNHILFNYNESRGTYSTDVIPNFKSDAEAAAYNEALKKLKEPITDLDELVRLKVIKSIPAAPAGKKYAVNKKTLKVELIDASAQP